ncbi:glucosamine-6-phosphate deaminase [Porphyromonas macacae]|uniref:glucosamine-6-phosphate deaminase n=1 Tax=Porphyromonas macacae TaxID=28115 RepID=UPI0035A0DA44
MRTNLSSLINLTKIPEQYYRPKNALERARLCRFEQIPTEIFASEHEGAKFVAQQIIKEIKQKQEKGEKYVLGLSGGVSPQEVYKQLVEFYRSGAISFENVYFVLAFEYYPLSSNSIGGNNAVLRETLFNKIDISDEQIISPDVTCSDDEVMAVCEAYEQKISSLGGLDMIIIGIGVSASLGFNASGSNPNSMTRLVLLDDDAKEAAYPMFQRKDAIPACAISLGMSTIFSAKRIALIAWGQNRAKEIKAAIEGKISDAIPASVLQKHNHTRAYLDLSAASSLTRIDRPWLVTDCEWNSKLIRRAIVWLCEQTNKPVLKLTNKDYNDHSLGGLLTKDQSAYDVNIRVFNDIQHTITGWPGGKPNADDSNRPERAIPYPKRIIVFSPHPDDDVISMGGTLRKLVQQGHDVHVAYQTSGNIAVGDEEVIRYVSYLRNVCRQYGEGKSPVLEKAEEIRKFLMEEKVEGEPERIDVRFMKGTIRREEARTACRFVGVPEDHIHFLDLPFYETGMIKKNPIGKEDIDIVKQLIEQVKPDAMFVAGDLADPHGTHRVCLDAILAAVDMVKNDEWFKNNCWIWMYRGAWAEWEIEHIEMAVPMSPEELRFKRNSILKHQSQMESAPFLGNDERLFWQRAEDRNRDTAKLYERLGLASYEAIEAFVRYHPVD